MQTDPRPISQAHGASLWPACCPAEGQCFVAPGVLTLQVQLFLTCAVRLAHPAAVSRSSRELYGCICRVSSVRVCCRSSLQTPNSAAILSHLHVGALLLCQWL